ALSGWGWLPRALAARPVQRAAPRPAVAPLSDRPFAPRPAEPSRSGGASPPPRPSPIDPMHVPSPDGVAADLLAALRDALRRNDEAALRALAALAVQQFGGIDAQRVGSASYYLYRVLRRLDLSNLLQRALHHA